MFEFLRVRTLEDACATLEKHWKPSPGVIQAPPAEALGRSLAEDVVSEIDVPPFNRSALDGYVVRAADTFGAEEDSPVRLSCIGRLAAGEWYKGRLRRGLCLEISTGAPIPSGGDAVVGIEQTIADGRDIYIHRAVAPSENIAQRGSDIKKGEKIARRGEVLTLADMGALVSAGVRYVKVYVRPRVGVISSGDELIEVGKRLRMGKIYDTNGPVLCEMVKMCGAVPVYLGVAPDSPTQIRRFIMKALPSSDVVLLSGGSSAGAGDIIPWVVDQMGEPGVIVHGLAMKPGKPTFIAVLRGKPIFGLPGYPVSALMVFDQLVAPYLRRLSGLPSMKRAKIRARLTSKLLSARGRREFVPVKLIRKGEEFFAEPILKGSGAITSLSQADGYIDVPIEQEIVERGEFVEVFLFGGDQVG